MSALAAHAQHINNARSTDATGLASADEPVQLEYLVVTASPFSRDQAELASATNVLAGQSLLLAQHSSLGATLSAQPGIASNYFGPGADRPVIRGLGGDRLRILENSVGTIDASVISPDHAVALEPLLARRIEVVRGPATLLYGSNAVGGVVNILDNRIPDEIPHAPITGQTEARHGSAANEYTGVASLDGAAGAHIAWHVDGLRRETEDVGIPGYANPAEPADYGTLPNSAISTTAYSAGLSLIGDAGYAGVSGKRYETEYGTVAESDVTIHLVEKRFDFAGEITRPFGIFSGARGKFGVSDYTHIEFEGGAPGTTFTNNGYEGRIELLHEKLARRLDGSWGVQFLRSDFSAIGDEVLMPSAVTENQALFAFEEMPLNPVTFQFGLRAERQHIDSETDGGTRRTDNIWSASIGAVIPLGKTKTWALTASLARTERAPNAQELFSNGPHPGTGSFEVGDPSLGSETSYGVDIGLRKKLGFITGSLSIFANRFSGYIFQQQTGAVQDDFPVYQYTAGDVTFHGAELELLFHLHQGKAHTLDLALTSDIVRAQNTTARSPLPRITPARAALELRYKGPAFSASLGMQTVDRARNLAPGETPTAGYGFLGANAAWRLKLSKRVDCEIFARGTNLANQEARNNVSFLKDIAPLPGRDVTIGVRLVF